MYQKPKLCRSVLSPLNSGRGLVDIWAGLFFPKGKELRPHWWPHSFSADYFLSSSTPRAYKSAIETLLCCSIRFAASSNGDLSIIQLGSWRSFYYQIRLQTILTQWTTTIRNCRIHCNELNMKLSQSGFKSTRLNPKLCRSVSSPLKSFRQC